MKSARSSTLVLIVSVAMSIQTAAFAIDYRDPTITESHTNLKRGYALPVLSIIDEAGQFYPAVNLWDNCGYSLE